MGRRFLLFLGILLFAAPAPPPAHAQDGGAGAPAPDAAPPASSELPPPKPIELTSPDQPTTSDEKPDADPAGAAARKGTGGKKTPDRKTADKKKARPAARDRGAVATKDDDRPAAPSSDAPAVTGLPTVSPPEAATGAGGLLDGSDPSRPPQDPEVSRADGAGQSAGQPQGVPARPVRARQDSPGAVGGLAPSRDESKAPPGPNADPPGDPGADGLPADRLPAGKQAVAVTVDVQSPRNMNLHQPATVHLVVRNTGASDALQVRIRDELPEGLKFVSSQPEARLEGTSVLSWSFGTMPGGSEKTIAIKVEPVKTGRLEHGASVWFQSGSKAQTQVFQPRLRIEQKASAKKVLKGQAVEFKVLVTNIGDGPARNVRVAAKLSPGLRHGSGDRGADEMITEPIPVLAPNQTEELDPLVAEAFKAGDQSCTVTARSPDVVPQDKDEEAGNVATVTVVEPKLTLSVSGPPKRCTDTHALYEIAVGNPGTAPARKVRVVAFVPPGARLLSEPKGARYDAASRRLQWSIDALEPAPGPRKLAFEVKVGTVGKYEVSAEAVGDGGLRAKAGTVVTEVFGMPDVDLVVSERQRVVDVGEKTVFLIRLRNYGTKDATNILLSATVSKNLKVTGSAQVPDDLAFMEKDGQLVLKDAEGHGIKHLGPGQELVMGLEVQVTGAEPKLATCRVKVEHDDLSGGEGFEDMAGVKVLPSSSRPADPGGQ